MQQFKKIKFLVFFTSFLASAYGQYDYSLEDLNSSSTSYGQEIGTTYFQDHVTLHYFGHFTWGTCTNRFGQLNNLYDNLKAQGYNIELIGVAKASQSSSSGNWTNNNNSPVCVDVSPYDVWSSWNASQRDLFVLDLNGDLVLHQNITSGVPDNLESLIIDLLGQSGTDLCDINYMYVSEAHTSGNPEDYIEIYNSGENDCSLEGFKLDNSQDMTDLIFDNIVVPAGGYWLGYKGSDSSFGFDLNSVGDEVWLSDPLGNTKVITLSASVELNDVQLSQSFSSDGGGCYTAPTPGENNADCITLEIDVQNTLPQNILLSNNYPNPFNPTTYIPIEMKNSENIIIEIFDVRGNVVNTIFSGFLDRGTHKFQWNGIGADGKEVGSGVYFFIVKSKSISLSKKMVFAK